MWKRERLAGELELTDRDQAKVALRRALDGKNMAAMVAAAKALIEFDRSPDREHVTVEDARAKLIARLDQIAERRRAHGEACPACGGAGYIRRSRGRGSEPKQVWGESPVVAPASVAGRPSGENPRLPAQATWNLRSRSLDGPVRPPDSVLVQATYAGAQQEISLDAISGRRGEDPDGALNMVWGPERSTGRVTCMNVEGNRAAVGISMQPTAAPPPGATAVTYLLFEFTDNGSPGAGRDTFSLMGGGGPMSCTFPPTLRQEGGSVIPITTGDITIVDTP